MKSNNNTAKELYELLLSRNFEPDTLDSKGKPSDDLDNTEIFSFDYKTPNKNYGTIVVLLGKDKDIVVFFSDNLGRNMEGEDKEDWYDFLYQLRMFAKRNLLTFSLQNMNRLKYTMQGMAAIKEGLFEGYYGTKKISYSDQPKKTKLVIKHNRTLGENDARYRYIESLFVETDAGERFKLPFTKLVGGRAMARHCAEGGNPYDAFGQHISQMMSEMNTLSRFARAAQHKTFEGEAGALAEQAVKHYQYLKSKAKRMISQRGYREEREAFDPAEIPETESTVDSIRSMFIEQSLDSRIEEALPLLAKLKETEMKEADVFEQWTDRVVEGTWALPDTPEALEKLQELMSQELPVGPDGTNATEQLYDVVGDDVLFDRLVDLAEVDPDADARPIIQARLAELGMDVEIPNTESVEEALSHTEKGQLFNKFANIVKSIKTPEQFASAKRYGDLLLKKLRSEQDLGLGAAAQQSIIDSNLIQRELQNKAKELGIDEVDRIKALINR